MGSKFFTNQDHSAFVVEIQVRDKPSTRHRVLFDGWAFAWSDEVLDGARAGYFEETGEHPGQPLELVAVHFLGRLG